MHPLLWIYEGLWFVLSLLGVPFFLKRKRKWLLRRWFWNGKELTGDCEDCIWIHALSMGELFSVWNLPKLLKEELKENKIFLSIGTQKAFEYLKKHPHPWVDAYAPMPLDFYPSIRRLCLRIKPRILVIVESDIWPFLIWYLTRRAVPVMVINGRLSLKTFKNYSRFRPLLRILFRPIKKWLVQSPWDEKRLIETGVFPKAKIKTTGNLKFDTNWDAIVGSKEKWLKELRLQAHEAVLVAGSTHKGEEEILLKALVNIRQRYNLKAIIGPRDPNRAEEIFELSSSFGLRVFLRSSGVNKDWDIIIVDTLGELREIYGVGIAAFVGGSLIPFGGHNLLEPAAHGIPVLFGPYAFNFTEIQELLLCAGGGVLVRDADEIVLELERLLSDPQKRAFMGKNAKDVAYSQRGRLMRVVEIIKEDLGGGRT